MFKWLTFLEISLSNTMKKVMFYKKRISLKTNLNIFPIPKIYSPKTSSPTTTGRSLLTKRIVVRKFTIAKKN